MEIYQFRQLVAVAEASSFTCAAAHLGVSQPARRREYRNWRKNSASLFSDETSV